MIEILNLSPHKRYPGYKLNTSNVYRGTMVYVEGVATDGQQLVNQVPSGAAATLVAASVAARRSYFMIDKYYMIDEFGSDTSDAVDKIAKGADVVIYGAGEFATDKFVWASLGTPFAAGGSRWSQVSTANTYSGNYWKNGLGTALVNIGNMAGGPGTNNVQPRPLWVSTNANTRGWLTATCANGATKWDAQTRIDAIQGRLMGVWNSSYQQIYSSSVPFARVKTIESMNFGI